MCFIRSHHRHGHQHFGRDEPVLQSHHRAATILPAHRELTHPRFPDRDCVRRITRSALAAHGASEIQSAFPFQRAAAGAPRTAALRYSSNTPSSIPGQFFAISCDSPRQFFWKMIAGRIIFLVRKPLDGYPPNRGERTAKTILLNFVMLSPVRHCRTAHGRSRRAGRLRTGTAQRLQDPPRPRPRPVLFVCNNHSW